CRKYDRARRQYGIRLTLRDALGNDFNCTSAVLRFLSNTGLDKAVFTEVCTTPADRNGGTPAGPASSCHARREWSPSRRSNATPPAGTPSARPLASAAPPVLSSKEYRRVFNHDAPTAKSIKKWHDIFLATGSVLKKHDGGRRTSDEMVANVQAAYERSPRKSLRRASRELQVTTNCPQMSRPVRI
ncbi:hypothetical protein ANN_22970, partial [Periplaneta americana]